MGGVSLWDAGDHVILETLSLSRSPVEIREWKQGHPRVLPTPVQLPAQGLELLPVARHV